MFYFTCNHGIMHRFWERRWMWLFVTIIIMGDLWWPNLSNCLSLMYRWWCLAVLEWITIFCSGCRTLDRYRVKTPLLRCLKSQPVLEWAWKLNTNPCYVRPWFRNSSSLGGEETTGLIKKHRWWGRHLGLYGMDKQNTCKPRWDVYVSCSRR